MNVLEAIILPVTVKEIDNGSFERFMSQLKKIDQTDITFLILINTIGHSLNITPLIDAVAPKFKGIEVAYANIPQEDDIYCTDGLAPREVPTYGLVSGPNLMFLASMDLCKRFDTTLLIEVDCVFKPNFIQVLQGYCLHSGGFLISGTTYDGPSTTRYTSPDFHHINGVALYKTGDHLFQYLTSELDKYIVESVKTDTPYLAYDIAMIRMIFRNITLESTRGEWKRLYKRILKTPFIVNLSAIKDAYIENIIENYPSAVIIHKKLTDKDVHSLRGFLVQD